MQGPLSQNSKRDLLDLPHWSLGGTCFQPTQEAARLALVGNGLSGLAGLGSKDEHRAGLAKTSRKTKPIPSWQVCPGTAVPATPGQGWAVLAGGGAGALTSTASAEPVEPEGPWEVGWDAILPGVDEPGAILCASPEHTLLCPRNRAHAQLFTCPASAGTGSLAP